MSLIAATPELPLYLQMSRYTKGSQAVMELRTERFLAAQAEHQPSIETSNRADDEIITGSIGDGDQSDKQGGFSFDDFLDTINPLQHLPIISTLYRNLTGDQIEPAARIVGGALFGGPLGAGLAVADSVLEEATGASVGAHLMSWLKDDAPGTIEMAVGKPAIPIDAADRSHQEAQSAAETANLVATRPTSHQPGPTENIAQSSASQILDVSVASASVPIDISAAMSAALDKYIAAQRLARNERE